MSAEYIFLIDDQQYGPVSFADLKTMAANGQITDETQVRLAEGEAWASWRNASSIAEMVALAERSAAGKQMQKDQPNVVVRKLDLPEVRDKLRKLTAYPQLRGAMTVLLTLSALGIPACILVAFFDLEVGIVTAVACLGSVLSTLLLGAFLDIADALLAKLD